MNILHAQGKQRQQYDDGFLLIPCDVIDNRQLVDILQSKYLLQFQSDDGKRVTVVALSGIEYAWNTVDIAKRQFVVFVFGAASRQNHSVLRLEEHTSELQSPDHLVC